MIKINSSTSVLKGSVLLESSKSISNRILIIKALSNQQFKINNLSSSEDTQLMIELLKNFKTLSKINCNHAGTTFRFLTAFLSTIEGEWILEGSNRMHQRPIGPLVNCLNEMGANIKYLNKKNHPPLKISGRLKKGGSLKIRGDISSQYISALLMIAPTLKNGLEISINSKVLSKPYINMTLSLMGKMGIKYNWNNNKIIISTQNYSCKDYIVENDWSSASFWYSFAALSTNAEIEIPLLVKNSLQGDAQLHKIYEKLGVTTKFFKDKIIIKKCKLFKTSIRLNLNDYPDIALPIITTCAGLGIETYLYGLESLKHKESDRLLVIKNELNKFGVFTEIDESSIKLSKNQSLRTPTEIIKTHNDHRIPMSIAPLCLKTKFIEFDDINVVNKSYPKFWKDLENIGINCNLN